MTAIKHDNGKAPMSLLSTEALRQTAEILAFGAKKYAADNWRGGMAWRRLIDAAMRHLTAFADGEDRDPESGLSHLAHASCCLMFLQEYQAKNLGTDDRYKAPVDPEDADDARAVDEHIARVREGVSETVSHDELEAQLGITRPRSSWSVRDDAPEFLVGRTYRLGDLPTGVLFTFCGREYVSLQPASAYSFVCFSVYDWNYTRLGSSLDVSLGKLPEVAK